jgi:hypothetical protein
MFTGALKVRDAPAVVGKVAQARSKRTRQAKNREARSGGPFALASSIFKISPECHHSPPPESNSEVKKGFQGSGFDLGLNFGVATA